MNIEWSEKTELYLPFNLQPLDILIATRLNVSLLQL